MVSVEEFNARTDFSEEERAKVRANPRLLFGADLSSRFGRAAFHNFLGSLTITGDLSINEDNARAILIAGGTALLFGLAVKDLVIGDPKSMLAFIGNITFAQFIHEEAIQTVSFPVRNLITEGEFDEAEKLLRTGEQINESLKSVNSSVGILNPLTTRAFELFAEATDKSIASNRLLVQKARGKRRGKGAVKDLR